MHILQKRKECCICLVSTQFSRHALVLHMHSEKERKVSPEQMAWNIASTQRKLIRQTNEHLSSVKVDRGLSITAKEGKRGWMNGVASAFMFLQRICS